MSLKQCFVFFILIVACHTVNAQDYQSFRSDRRYSFNTQLHLGFDSVGTISGDSIFKPFNNIWHVDSTGCNKPYDGSFIGKYVLIRQNGFDQFVNLKLDTISIKRNARLGERWLMYQSDDKRFFGSVVAHEVRSFLGLTDSVKIISIQVEDTAMNPINHHLANDTIILSKNDGMIRCVFFRFFPDYEERLYENGIYGAYNGQLIGMTRPEVGFQDLTTFGIYDYNIGDEIHIEEFTNWGKAILTRSIYIYKDRKDYLPDSIVYTIVKHKRVRTGTKDTVTTETRSRVITPIDDLEVPSETPVNFVDRYKLAQDGSVRTLTDVHSSLDGGSNFDCLVKGWWDGCFSEMVYRKGLGGPYHYCENNMQLEEKKWRTLVYYKKGSEEWGKPFTDVGIDERSAESLIIYPNPTRNYVIISHPLINKQQAFKVELYNLQGALVSSEITATTAGNEIRLDLSGLPAGTYLVRCYNSSNAWMGRVGVAE